MSAQASFARLVQTDRRGALVTVIAGRYAGEHLLLTADGTTEGELSDPGLEAQAIEAARELMWNDRSERRGELFIDVVAPRPRLLIFGAVDYARHLAQFARVLGWRPYVIDPRGRFAIPERFPDAAEVVVAWPREAIARLGAIDPATYIAVLTHDPKIDDEVLVAALAAAPAYVGAIGSRRTQAARRQRLLARGVSEDDLDRISGPIGLDLGALTAAETALSIMAEIVAVKHARAGGRLRASRGRIHDAVA